MQFHSTVEKINKPVRQYNESKRPDSKRGKESTRMEHQRLRRAAARGEGTAPENRWF